MEAAIKVDERQQAIESCSCPRAPWEALEKPLCNIELCTAGEQPVIFVNRPPALHCGHLKPFGNGNYCTCEKRQYLYRHYGV